MTDAWLVQRRVYWIYQEKARGRIGYDQLLYQRNHQRNRKGLEGIHHIGDQACYNQFVLLCLGFVYFGIDFWFLKALGIAVFDLIPILGSGMVMGPLGGDPSAARERRWLGKSSYCIILVVVRQIAEPFITGKELGIRPLYTFLATVVCILLFGPIGAVLGAVVAVVIKAVLEVSKVSAKTIMTNIVAEKRQYFTSTGEIDFFRAFFYF